MKYRIQQLEERIVLDAEIANEIDSLLEELVFTDAENKKIEDKDSLSIVSPYHSSSDRMILISKDIVNFEHIENAALAGVDTVSYVADGQSYESILDILSTNLGNKKVKSLAIVNHARAGVFSIAEEMDISLDSLKSVEFQIFWRSLGEFLLDEGRIDLLGCNLTKSPDGKELIRQLEEIGGFSIAASDDITGIGGDWHLEYGNIDLSSTYFSQEKIITWQGSLLEIQGANSFSIDENTNTVTTFLAKDNGTSTYTNWAGGEPNNYGYVGEDYAIMYYSNGLWNDAPGSGYRSIMESTSELDSPTNYSFLGSYNNHYYYISNSSSSWGGAKSNAETAGGYLVVINNEAENTWLKGKVAPHKSNSWIGFSDKDVEGNWIWVSHQEIISATWSISGDDASLFSIDSSTGELSFKSPPNFESPVDSDQDNSYKLIITATDSSNNSTSQAITISVQDLNEAPVFSTFTLSDLDGIELWLDSNNIDGSSNSTLNNNESLSTWDDKGNNTLTLTASSTQPVYQDSDNGVYFANGSYFSFDSFTDGLDEAEIFVVVKNDASTGNGHFHSWGDFSNSHFPYSDGKVYENFARNYRYNFNAQNLNLNEYFIYNIKSEPNAYQININGSEKLSSSDSYSVSFGASNKIGEGNWGSWQGNILELVFLSNVTTQDEKEKINYYLSSKWGLEDRVDSDGDGTVDSSDTESPSVGTSNFLLENTTFVGVVSASDEENNTISYSLTGGDDASLFSIDSSTGELSFTNTPNFESPLDNGQDNTYELTITATDSSNNSTSQAITISVQDLNEAPTISSTAITSIEEDSLYSYTVTATDVDAGDTLSLEGTTIPTWLSFDAATGVLSGTPRNEHVDSHSVVLTATDSTGATVTDSFSITVSNTNDAPTISSTAITSIEEDNLYSYTVTATDVDEGDAQSLSFVGTTIPTWLSFNAATGVLSGTPRNEHVDSHSVVITATDSTGATVTDSFSITVSNTNDAPTISSTAITSIEEDSLYSYTVTATDVDVGDTLSLEGTTIPTWLSFNAATGVLSGTPRNEHVDSHAVVITATDSTGATVTDSFSITVSNTNDAPTISSTAITSIEEDSLYSYTVTATDVDAGDTLSLEGTTIPTWLSFNAATGVLSGTPRNEHVDSHSVVITATDSTGATVTDSFSITVSNTNDAPTISSTAITSIEEDSLYSYTVTATDVDVGDTLSLEGTTIPTWLSFNAATGVLSGTPRNEHVDSHSVVITATDSTGATVTDSFSITVSNTNDAPTISSTAITSIEEDSLYSYTVTATDVDAGDTLSLEGTTIPTWLSFNAATGVLSGTPRNEHVDSHSVVITATDSTGATVTDSFSITVSNTNDAPTISSTAITSIEEDSLYSYTVTAADVDAGDTVSLEGTTIPTWLSFNAATGVLSGTPRNEHVDSHSVVITATDSTGATVTDSFSITVSNTNDAPTISSTAITSIEEDSLYSYTVTATDVDAGDTLSLEGTTIPTWLSFNAATGVLSGTPRNEHVDSHSVVITATDSTGATVTDSFSITVSNTNDAPTISSTAITSIEEDSLYSYTVTATDVDVGDTLSLEGTTIPTWLSFNAATGVLSGTPRNEHVDSHAVVITATDSTGATVTDSFSITVSNTNDAPTISSTAITSIEEDSLYSYTVTATDVDAGDTLSLEGTTIPTWLSFNAATGVLSGTPRNEHVDSHSVVLTATDSTGATVTDSFSITVSNTNDAPTISSTAITSIEEDSLYSYTVTATDVDVGDTLSLEGTTIPTWLSFNAATGVLSGTPRNEHVDSHSVVITATDSTGATVTDSFSITVSNTNDAPTISSTAITSIEEDSLYSYTVTATDVDAGDTLSLEGTTIPTWLSFNAATGVLSGTPRNEHVDSHSVVITATDSTGATVTDSFSITVSNTNDAPTISSTAITSIEEDSLYSYTVTATDVDVGDTLSLEGTTIPTWLSFNAATGVLSGTPRNEHVDSHSVVLTATDSTGATVTDSFSITVSNTNDAPTISSTAITSIEEDSLYSYTVTATDVDVGDTLSLEGTTIPTWLSFNAATGVLSGTPRNEHVDSHAVVITATDSTGATVTDSFSITVSNTNDAPTISSTAITSIEEDSLYSYTVTATDVDAGDTLSLEGTTIPTWLSFNAATGVLSGTPRNEHVDSHSVVITATDSTGATVTDSFSITVSNTNDAPTISSTAITSIEEDSLYSYTVTATDVDAGDTLSLEGTTIPTWLSFNAATGVLSGTPRNEHVDSHSVVITATDSTGATVTDSFSITVSNTNDAPTISSTAITSIEEDSLYSYTVTAADVDAGDTVSLEGTTIPTWLSFNAATGVLSGTPRNEHVDSHSVVITATDSTGATVTDSFSITVSNTNDAPTISSTAITSIEEDSLYSYTVTATDVDAGDTLSLEGTTIPTWLSFNAATGVLSGTPRNEHVSSHAVVITATDSTGATVTDSFSITVSNTNDAPTISSTAITSIGEDSLYSYTVTATDVDAGDTLSLEGTTIPTWLSFNAAIGVLSGTPRNEHVDSHSVVITATDSTGATVTDSFSITVSNTNDAPTISSTAITSIEEDSLYSYTVTATDVDVGDTQSLSLEGTTVPSWLSFNAADGVLSGTPGNEHVGSHAVVITAKDSTGATVTDSFSITVSNTNDAPTISSTAITSIEEDSLYSYTVTATDVDAEDTVSLERYSTIFPSWLSFNAATGVLSGTPENDDVGSHTVVITATDSTGATVTDSFSITVSNTNDAPVINLEEVEVLEGSEERVFNLLEYASDIEGDDLSVLNVFLVNTESGEIKKTNDSIYFTPKEGFTGFAEVNFTVSDGEDQTNATLMINVRPRAAADLVRAIENHVTYLDLSTILDTSFDYTLYDLHENLRLFQVDEEGVVSEEISSVPTMLQSSTIAFVSDLEGITEFELRAENENLNEIIYIDVLDEAEFAYIDYSIRSVANTHIPTSIEIEILEKDAQDDHLFQVYGLQDGEVELFNEIGLHNLDEEVFSFTFDQDLHLTTSTQPHLTAMQFVSNGNSQDLKIAIRPLLIPFNNDVSKKEAILSTIEIDPSNKEYIQSKVTDIFSMLAAFYPQSSVEEAVSDTMKIIQDKPLMQYQEIKDILLPLDLSMPYFMSPILIEGLALQGFDNGDEVAITVEFPEDSKAIWYEDANLFNNINSIESSSFGSLNKTGTVAEINETLAKGIIFDPVGSGEKTIRFVLSEEIEKSFSIHFQESEAPTGRQVVLVHTSLVDEEVTLLLNKVKSDVEVIIYDSIESLHARLASGNIEQALWLTENEEKKDFKIEEGLLASQSMDFFSQLKAYFSDNASLYITACYLLDTEDGLALFNEIQEQTQVNLGGSVGQKGVSDTALSFSDNLLFDWGSTFFNLTDEDKALIDTVFGESKSTQEVAFQLHEGFIEVVDFHSENLPPIEEVSIEEAVDSFLFIEKSEYITHFSDEISSMDIASYFLQDPYKYQFSSREVESHTVPYLSKNIEPLYQKVIKPRAQQDVGATLMEPYFSTLLYSAVSNTEIHGNTLTGSFLISSSFENNASQDNHFTLKSFEWTSEVLKKLKKRNTEIIK